MSSLVTSDDDENSNDESDIEDDDDSTVSLNFEIFGAISRKIFLIVLTISGGGKKNQLAVLLRSY